ncbi:MAG TPA: pitrilysin family protein [Verrucomicrobiae bacterium]|jgi:zinc protease|nr:pitrilysin family protein [Verrucomicrobiae bacterium]
MKRSRTAPAFFFLFLSLLPLSRAEEAAAPFRLVKEKAGIQEYELVSNGLRVLVMRDASLPLASVLVTYKAGSRFETGGTRGIAHLIEHMMFKGTPRYHKDKGTAVFAVLQSLGAGIHGGTWKDGMEFVEIFPHDQLETVLDIEADRMRNSLLQDKDLKSEMPVVQSEFDLMENSPGEMLYNAVWGEAFQVHPYRYSPIGLRPDIEKARHDDLKKFYDVYFQPGNAVLAVFGNIETPQVLKIVEEKFGAIPAAPAIPEVKEREPEQKEMRRVELHKEEPVEMVMVAHKIPPAAHPDTAALEVLSQILCGGKLSRLYPLVEEGLASAIACEADKAHDPTLFSTTVTLAPGAKHAETEARIFAAYEALKKNPPSEAELVVAQNKILVAAAYRRDGFFNMALDMSVSIAAADWTLAVDFPEKIRKVTASDVQRAAQTYFLDGQATVGRLISKNPPPSAGGTLPEAAAMPSSEVPALAPEPAASNAAALPEKFSDRMTVSEHGGLTIVALRTATPGVMSVAGSFRGGGTAYDANPVLPTLTGELLDEGTTSRNKYEIAREIEARGMELEFGVKEERAGFKARFLSADQDAALGLIADQMRRPLFAETDFNIEKKVLESGIRQAMGDTQDQAKRALSRLLYPQGHPYRRPDYGEELSFLSSVTLQQVKDFHASHYGPQEMFVVAVGDVDPEAFEKSALRAFGDWEKKDVPALRIEKAAQGAAVKQHVPVPGKVNIDVTMGHVLDLERTSPDFVPVYMANRVLGGDFMGRLFTKVRDEKGLSYHVYSYLNGFDAGLGGTWQIDMTVNRKTLEPGLAAAFEEYEKFKRDGTFEQELQKKKTGALGNFQVGISTTPNLARELLRALESGLGAGYLDHFPEQVRALTVEDTNRAIREYFHPDKVSVVTAGDLQETPAAQAQTA